MKKNLCYLLCIVIIGSTVVPVRAADEGPNNEIAKLKAKISDLESANKKLQEEQATSYSVIAIMKLQSERLVKELYEVRQMNQSLRQENIDLQKAVGIIPTTEQPS